MSWIGVDLDGTLAHYDHWVSADHIGEPIDPMVERVRRWLRAGHEVRIVTARAFDNDLQPIPIAINAITKWCKEHIGMELPITNMKDFEMIELWDDRCVQVKRNTGLPYGPSEIDGEPRPCPIA